MRLGAHVSVSGGVEKAVERQEEIGGNCGQIFAGSPRTWSVAEYSTQDGKKFTKERTDKDQSPYCIHSTYLVNLGSPKSDLRTKSVNCLQKELNAAQKLGVEYVVFHPGAHTGSGRETGIEQVSQSIENLSIPENVTLLLENTAGKGTTLGKEFEELRRMIAMADKSQGDLGVCLDTCHMYAAGYDFVSNPDQVFDEIEEQIGGKVKMLHLNDSAHPLGSEKDEHEHIGEGCIGDVGFKNILSSNLSEKPMILETPTSNDKGYAENVDRVRSIAR